MPSPLQNSYFAARFAAGFAMILPILSSALFAAPPKLESIPDKLVVLTFDDSVKSHFTQARPILKRYGFGATFFITEGFTFKTNNRDYMTWEEIKALHDDGFEIGNHTADHMGVTPKNVSELERQLQRIDDRCKEFGIPKPTSFAWPGNSLTLEAIPILRKHGITFARRGGAPEYPYKDGQGFPYEPGRDDPFLIPSAGDARPHWLFKDFIAAVKQTGQGKIAVLQFHGVPEGEHPWVHTPLERFDEYMRYLHEEKYTVIPLRDLARYADPQQIPANPFAVIESRQQSLKQSQK